MDAPHLEVERELLREAFPASGRVLEAGCGRRNSLGDSLAPYRDRIAELVGVDLDAEAGRENPALDRFVQADLSGRLPFEDHSFDFVYASFVVEHLVDPAATFAEWRRILRPGAGLLVVTPNLANPVIWLGRTMPQAVRVALKRLGPGIEERDVHPAVYRANRKPTLASLGEENGLAPHSFRFVPTLSSYVGRRAAIARLVASCERLLPASRRSTIVALYRAID